MTQERFVNDPFVSGERMYKTGDFVKWLPDGNIEYLGRMDQQIKFHGYRIETQEIEARLLDIEAIREAAVLLVTQNESTYLCAYYSADRQLSYNELRANLSEVLPVYMIPTSFMKMDAIPLTPNGKIDRKALPEPIGREIKTTSDYISTSRTEQTVMTEIQELLNLSNIYPDRNFFELGGDSIKALILINRLHGSGILLETKDIIYSNSISDIVSSVKHADMSFVQSQFSGIVKKTPAMEWLMARGLPYINQRHQSVFLQLQVPIEGSELKRILLEIIRHHQLFRIRLDDDTGDFYLDNSQPPLEPEIDLITLSDYGLAELSKIMEEARVRSTSSLVLDRGNVVQACMFAGEDGQIAHLMLSAHRLVMDLDSWGILSKDLSTMLRLHLNGEAARLAAPRSIDLQPANGNQGSGKRTYDSLGIDANELLEANHAYHTRTAELLIIALVLTMHERLSPLAFGVEIDLGERGGSVTEDEVSGIGCLAPIYPAVFQVHSTDLHDQIKEVKEQIRGVLKDGQSLGGLQERLEQFEEPNRRLVGFRYGGDLDAIFENDIFTLMRFEEGFENSHPRFLDFRFVFRHRTLQLDVHYNPAELADFAVNEWVEVLVRNMKKIILHCAMKKTSEFTPSDFKMMKISQSDLDLLFE
ncbi:hypothetical protein D3H35_03265 [Cohnella faecalis]|uniref:Carrier domain-containing protein n=1 Tax=Cohnella faecalis TaxID=2315694 RepID=A0A398CS01_9BACL|nr:hypothetical protein D3H35_03265 [Cohnella faecalis]